MIPTVTIYARRQGSELQFQWRGFPWGIFAVSREFLGILDVSALPWYVSEIYSDKDVSFFQRSEYIHFLN